VVKKSSSILTIVNHH